MTYPIPSLKGAALLNETLKEIEIFHVERTTEKGAYAFTVALFFRL